MRQDCNDGRGLTCGEHGLYEWRELNWSVIGEWWLWFCPVCRMELRADKFSLPNDVPVGE